MNDVPTLNISSPDKVQDEIKIWIHENCFNNPMWFGEDRYFVTSWGSREDFEEINTWCQNQSRKASLYYVRLPVDEQKWMIGVVGSR